MTNDPQPLINGLTRAETDVVFQQDETGRITKVPAEEADHFWSHNPRWHRVAASAAETDASASVAGVSAASEPLEVVAWEWRKRLDVGLYEGEPYYCWSEWEALQPPYMDARELAKTDPVNYELRPMVLLSDAQSRIASLTAQVESMRADKAKACHIALKKSAENERLTADLAEARADRDRLDALVNSPETRDFLVGVRNEVAHQVERWGTVHGRAKEPADWFWLVGYLGGKALAAHTKGDNEKAMHHCISTSAALANWHTHVLLGGGGGLMQPGSSDLQDFLRNTFGANFIERQGAIPGDDAKAVGGEAQ